MEEKNIIKGGVKTRIVTPPQVKDTAPEVHECAECKVPILDKAPCGLKEIDGVKKVVCLKCKPKTKKELAEIAEKLQSLETE